MGTQAQGLRVKGLSGLQARTIRLGLTGSFLKKKEIRTTRRLMSMTAMMRKEGAGEDKNNDGNPTTQVHLEKSIKGS